jgi:aspartate racemase
MKAIGIIGGMGPAATVDLYAKIVAATAAARDQDHPRVLIDANTTMPDRNAALEGEGPSPAPMLAATAAGLERAGAELIAMSCNTAHAFQSDIEAAISVPFVSMIDATADATLARAPGAARVAVLAASGCVRAGLYQRAFAARGVEAVLLGDAEHARFMGLVYAIKGGDLSARVREQMRGLATGLLHAGPGALVGGCTEVPLVLAQGDIDAPLIDSAAALAARLVTIARA